MELLKREKNEIVMTIEISNNAVELQAESSGGGEARLDMNHFFYIYLSNSSFSYDSISVTCKGWR